MKAIKVRHQGCSVRGTSRMVEVGEPITLPDLCPSRPLARYYRNIDGGIGLRHDGQDYEVLAHPMLKDIEAALAERPFGGGE